MRRATGEVVVVVDVDEVVVEPGGAVEVVLVLVGEVVDVVVELLAEVVVVPLALAKLVPS